MISGLVLASCGLLLYAGAVMVLIPLIAARRRWTSSLPRTAIAVWIIGLGSGTLAALGGVGCAIQAARELESQTHGIESASNVAGGLTLTLLTCLAMSLAGGLIGTAIYRAALGALQRRRLRDTINARAPRQSRRSRLEATVIESSEANAISLGGRKPRIMISSRLRDHLSPIELDAVLEHERAHLTQHHHVLLHVADLQYRCASALPCARALDQSLHLLVELAADDAAARRCGTAAAASALRALGAMTKDEGYGLRAKRLENKRHKVGSKAMPVRI